MIWSNHCERLWERHPSVRPCWKSQHHCILAATCPGQHDANDMTTCTVQQIDSSIYNTILPHKVLKKVHKWIISSIIKVLIGMVTFAFFTIWLFGIGFWRILELISSACVWAGMSIRIPLASRCFDRLWKVKAKGSSLGQPLGGQFWVKEEIISTIVPCV